MANHAPSDYTCPICCLVQNIDCVNNHLRPTDIIHQNEIVTAFMAARRFPNNQGHVLVIHNPHFENIYDLPLEFTSPIHELTRAVALAMKATYHCDSILIRQHNEPDDGTDPRTAQECQAGILFLVIALVIAYFMGGSDPATRSVMGLGTAQRNISAALVVAAQNFDSSVITYIMVFAVIGFVVLFPAVGELGKRMKVVETTE